MLMSDIPSSYSNICGYDNILDHHPLQLKIRVMLEYINIYIYIYVNRYIYIYIYIYMLIYSSIALIVCGLNAYHAATSILPEVSLPCHAPSA